MAEFLLEDAIGIPQSNILCIYCQERKPVKQFYLSSSRNALLRMDSKNQTHLLVCKECAHKFFNYLCKILRTKEIALYHFCACLDVYYNPEVIKSILVDGDFINEYFKLIEPDIKVGNKTFIDSKGFGLGEVNNTVVDTTTFTDIDEENRREVLSLFRYDPFEEESPLIRKKLYRDLVTMTDPAMMDDLVKQRAAIEIVRSFARIDSWTKTLNDFTADPQQMKSNAKAIKELVETKNKEIMTITTFSKDHGFASRYANSKAKGAGTLSAAIRDMEEFNYDDGKVNAYDIKTSKGIEQAVEFSTNAIMRQLSLGEADYVDMVKTQREHIVKLEAEILKVKEEARLIYKQISKQELLKELAKELKKKGLGDREIEQAVSSEINI